MLLELALSTLLLASGTTAAAYSRTGLARARRSARRSRNTVRRAARRTRKGLAAADRGLERAARAYVAAKREERVRATPIEDLRKLGVSRVRWDALRSHGIHSLADLMRRSAGSLESLPGVGPTTANAVSSGARNLVARLAEEPVDVPLPDSWSSPATPPFGRAAWTALEARERLAPAAERLEQELGELEPAWGEVRGKTRLFDWLLRRADPGTLAEVEERAAAARARVAALESDGVPGLHAEPGRAAPTDEELAADFERRYADYAALFEQALHAVSPYADAPEAAPALRGPHRGIPADVARRIEAHPLDTRTLKVTLRRYQEFGAKYVLAQERTVLGDEMGLGKTIQALAAMVHLANAGRATRFLVVCPASILRNWAREIGQRTELEARLLHGAERDALAEQWMERGGVAVTSYSTLRNLALADGLGTRGHRIGLCVVDEAHYAKNPDAARSKAVREVALASDRLCLMSGTPLENRLAEFRHLIAIVAPEIAGDIPEEELGFVRIAPLVAPVYLRRNQPDVLRELPERIEMEEWLDLFPSDRAAYRGAAAARNYMAMRRAATIGDGETPSAKVARLTELLEEYRASERKVVVFSFFLDVLEALEAALDPIGTLRGSVPPVRRQELVDAFQAATGFALLLAQIEAGGVGINLQAASVVVLMEPQWKPSTENQAIARAHRMGQTRHVLVHRMLARESVDERMVELLRGKQDVFDRNVRESELKQASPEATERGFAEAVIDEELARQERLRPPVQEPGPEGSGNRGHRKTGDDNGPLGREMPRP